MGNADRFITPKAAAELLRDQFGHGSHKTLAKLRSVGGGPKFHRVGRHIYYNPEEVLRWARSKLGPALSSTSDKCPTPERQNGAA